MTEHDQHRAIFNLSRDVDDITKLLKLVMNTFASLELRIEDLEVEAATRHALSTEPANEPPKGDAP